MEVRFLASKLILGHMPFIGVSYINKERDKEYHHRFSQVNATKKVVEAAIQMGVYKFASATPRASPLSTVHLEALELVINEGYNVEIFSCVEIPVTVGKVGVDPFRRWATYAKLEGKLHSDVKERMIADPILNFREDWKRRLPAAKPYKKQDYRRLDIDWNRIDEDFKSLSELPAVHIELGSETDFLTMTGRFDLLGELVDRAKRYCFRTVLLGSHHAGVTIPTLDNKLNGFQGYVTPLNPLGIMMFPTQLSVEKAVKDTIKSVYAIKPLAGGRTNPKESFTYVFNFDVDGCMVGVGSVAELREDAEAAAKVLGNVNRGHEN